MYHADMNMKLMLYVLVFISSDYRFAAIIYHVVYFKLGKTFANRN